MALRVTLIPGDGIGPEITVVAQRVIAATGVSIQWDLALAGAAALGKHSTTLPPETVKSIAKNRVALKGPLATPVGEGYTSVNVALRKKFELYANIRPVQNLKGLQNRYPYVNIVIVRENTEDLYSGIEHEVSPGVVESVKVITRKASTRIAKYAFAYAKAHKRRKITAIHKANIMKLSDGLFLDCARGIAKRHPGIEYEEMIVDNACMQLVLDPSRFDVLLLENLYGDIVSDLCAGLVGGLGVVPGANMGDKVAIFEAVHGTAPTLAGKNCANPVALLLSSSLMLEHLGEPKAAARIRRAVDHVLGQPGLRTPDLGGTATMDQMAAAIVEAVKKV